MEKSILYIFAWINFIVFSDVQLAKTCSEKDFSLGNILNSFLEFRKLKPQNSQKVHSYEEKINKMY